VLEHTEDIFIYSWTKILINLNSHLSSKLIYFIIFIKLEERHFRKH